jgi:hypothetical protein
MKVLNSKHLAGILAANRTAVNLSRRADSLLSGRSKNCGYICQVFEMTTLFPKSLQTPVFSKNQLGCKKSDVTCESLKPLAQIRI